MLRVQRSRWDTKVQASSIGSTSASSESPQCAMYSHCGRPWYRESSGCHVGAVLMVCQYLTAARLVHEHRSTSTNPVDAVLGSQLDGLSPCRTCALCGCSRMTRNRKLSGQDSRVDLNFPFADHTSTGQVNATPLARGLTPSPAWQPNFIPH
jgi:hypothetical protein